MKQEITWSYLTALIVVAAEAGAAILDIYNTDFEVSYKEDLSPLTIADQRSHSIILTRLQALVSQFPVLSEEGKTISYDERKGWEYFWLVDPLDGTKEFVKRNGEFTVNIALISGDAPVMGVVHAPALNVTYFAASGGGAFRRRDQGEPERIRVSDFRGETLRVVGSRSHAGEALERFLSGLPPHELLSMGSSLKLCLVAEGSAHLYPRLGPTMEWDTAAAQCIVEEAGGLVTDFSGNRLRYNKENLLNANFIVACSAELITTSRNSWTA